MGKRILALDIGITTGFAILYNEPGMTIVEEYGEIMEDWYQETLKSFNARLISHSIAERPVIIRGQLGDRLAHLIAVTEEELPGVKMVDPAQWKSSPAKDHPTPRGTSTHIKDAIRLGVWYAWQLKSL